MDVQFGKLPLTSGHNILPKASPNSTGENFFASTQNTPQEPQEQQTALRINDFDSNILENNAYQKIPDDMFKLEHKIELLENSLQKINSEIEALQSLGADIQISDLLDRKKKIENALEDVNNKYAQLGLGAKISGQITSVVGKKTKKNNYLVSVRTFISKNVLAKISKKFDYKITMKEALENLSNINSSVDELINLKTPYGETLDRYEKLTAYLNKANVIHSQIAKNINNLTPKKA